MNLAEWIEQNRSRFTDLSDAVWGFAERLFRLLGRFLLRLLGGQFLNDLARNEVNELACEQHSLNLSLSARVQGCQTGLSPR